MKKIILFTFLMLSFLSCFRKKTPDKKDVETELERMFPNQFQVLNSNLKIIDVMAQFRGDKQAVVGDKSDPEVQFLLDWHKGTESAGFDSSTVMAAHERSKTGVTHARAWFNLLKNKGLDKFSVGVIERTAFIHVFLEPTPAARKQTLEIVKAVLDGRSEQAQTSIFIAVLEPEAFQQLYQHIIPLGHWKTDAGVQKEQMILSLNFESGPSVKVSELMRHWEINTGAKRLCQAQDDAFKTALAWAEKHLPLPCFMSSELHTYEVLENDEPALRFGFPYWDKDSKEEDHPNTINEAKGYVVGVYFFDKKVFTQLQQQADF